MSNATALNGDAVAVEDLAKRFRGRRGSPDVIAVDEISFTIAPGETLGLVGESGSGKSTVARCLLGLIPADSGRVDVLGRTITGAPKRTLRSWRRDMQIVFQEPQESLSPRIRVGQAIAEPLELHTDMDETARQERVRELLELVALAPELESRYPHQLSGGQQQRVNIARALRDRAQGRRARRADLVTRRVGASRDPEAARAAPAGVQPHVPDDLARPANHPERL